MRMTRLPHHCKWVSGLWVAGLILVIASDASPELLITPQESDTATEETRAEDVQDDPGGQIESEEVVELPVEPTLETKARKLMQQGRASEAVKLIEGESQPAERDADLWFLLAQAYQTLTDSAGLLKKGEYSSKLKRALEAALELEPKHVEARRELADFYYFAPWIAGGSKQKAEAQLVLLEAHAPAVAWTIRGEYARHEGELKAARDHYRKALEFKPRLPGRLLVLGVLEQQLDRYEVALELLDEAILAAPDLEQAYYYRAQVSALAGLDIDRGLECAVYYIEHCSVCDDSALAYGWWRRATLLKRKHDTEGAIAAYREALRLNPELEGARNGLEELL